MARQLEGQQQGTRSALLLEEADAFEQGGSACPDGMPAPLLAHLRYACATRCRHMLDHESLLLIAGGTGISAFLSILASLTCPVYRASKVSKVRRLPLKGLWFDHSKYRRTSFACLKSSQDRANEGVSFSHICLHTTTCLE